MALKVPSEISQGWFGREKGNEPGITLTRFQNLPYQAERAGNAVAPQDGRELRIPGIEENERAPDILVPGIIVFPDPVPSCTEAVQEGTHPLAVPVQGIDAECARSSFQYFAPSTSPASRCGASRSARPTIFSVNQRLSTCRRA